jgi:transcription initiation factor TFIIB
MCRKKDNASKNTQTLCSICNRNDRIVTDSESGEIICGNCGMVISDKIEDASHLERHIFVGGQMDEARVRMGAPTSLARHDMGLATIIGRSDRDASGQKIDSLISSTMQRLRMWDFRVHLNTSSDRLELDHKVPNPDPVKCIARVANNTNVSEKTKRHALDIIDKVIENEISAGKNPMGVAATVLYISCIKTGENISKKEISNAAGVTAVTLRNRFKDLRNRLTDLN